MTQGVEAPVVLRLENITKRFGALTANDGVGFVLRQGEVIALLGENGAGKTTLMNILFGHYLADEGIVEVFGRPLPPGNPRAALAAGVGMVHQHFTLADNLSVLENIVLGTVPLWRPGFGRGAARARIVALSRDFGLSVHPDARVADLSVGERQRVEILKALYRDARVLILDEPTAVLTPQETEALFATLRLAVARGLSVIFISHKLHEVMAISSRVLVLRHGRLVGEVATTGTDRHALAALMVGAEVAAPVVPPVLVGPALLCFERVSAPDQGSVPGLKAIDLILRAGQITGLAGVSGNGQGALAELMAGLARPVSGRMLLAGVTPEDWSPRAAIAGGIARIPEDRHSTGTIADLSLTENAIIEVYGGAPFSHRGWMDWRAAEAFAAHVIETYDVRCPGPGTRVRMLSGGNMQKLILGRVLEPGPRIILANQPVRGLDVGAVAYVHSRLLRARGDGAAVLLISEDLEEVMALSDVIHVISGGRLSPEFAPDGAKSAAELGAWMAGHGSRTGMRLEAIVDPTAARRLGAPALALGLTVLVAAGLALVAGANPFAVLGLIVKGAAGSKFAALETLNRATPLIFTGLAVAVAFRARLWNIGAEAQLYAGAVVTVLLGTGALPLPSFLILPALAVAAMLAGALVLLGPAVLKTRFGVDEVVTTLLFNFITLFFVSMLLEGPLKDPMSLGWPQSKALIPEARLPRLVPGLRLHWGFGLALIAAVAVWVLERRTTLGFAMRAVGLNAGAARFAGIPVNSVLIKTAALSGGLAALAGFSEVAGLKGNLTLDLSPGFGYTGIIVAMLAQLNPLGVLVSALFVAGVFVGADSMSRAAGVPSYIADILLATALLSMVTAIMFTRYRVRRG